MRSKMLLLASVIASAYSVLIGWFYLGGAILVTDWQVGFDSVGEWLESELNQINISLSIQSFLFVLSMATLIHFCLFLIGCLISWIAYAKKSETVALAAAILFLISGICSPIGLVAGLTVAVLAFIGANDQKKLNHDIK